MFEFVRRHTRLLQFVLVVLIFPSFVFFGIEGYSSFFERGNDTVAEVAGHRITQAQWDEAHRNQVDRLRRQMPNLDSRMLDDPAFKRQTLEALVREQVLLAAADDLHLMTSDARLHRAFATDPEFAFLRNTDGSINRDALAAQGMSVAMFEQRLRQELSTRQVLQGMSGSVIAPQAVVGAAFDALLQQREVQVLRFDAKDYQGKVEVSDADVEAYYKDPAHAAQFRAPEQATVQYAVLDLEAIKKRVDVSEADARQYYEQNAARYATPEERRASHILVKAERGAPADERARAQEKAQGLLEQLRKNPDAFAELARKNSDDPGSAANGGDLDYFARGAMVKPFEDVAFKLKPGEISDVVETDFGYHIIKLTDVRGGERKPFDDVHAQIEDAIRTQKAQQRYAEAAVEFGNLVYEQPDSLKPVVDKLGLELQTAKGVTREPGPGDSGPLANAKVLEAVFSSDAIQNKRNTEAIELGANRMISARIVEYTPERTRGLDEVRDEVRAQVGAAKAAAQAREAGQSRLATLQKAPQTALDVPVLTVSRAQPHELPGPVLDALLKADAQSLPSFVGVDLDGRGYAVVKLIKVLGRDPAAPADRVRAQYAQLWSDAEARAYLEALKERFDVDMRGAAASTEPAPGR